MGNESSSPEKSFQKLAETTHFNLIEVQKLYQEFKQIAGQNSDKNIQEEEFFPILGIQNYEFGKKVFDAFDTSKDGNMQFEEYVQGISHICERASIEEKAKFCFDVYDTDGSGTISQEEVFEMLSSALTTDPRIRIPKDQVRKIAATLFKDLDKSKDGKVSFDEFLTIAKKNDKLVNCVSLTIQPVLNK